MGLPLTGNTTHDNNVKAAELARQVALAVSGLTQAAAKSADVTFYKTVLASALANGLPEVAVESNMALAALGQQGL
jgi:hypothetical protein